MFDSNALTRVQAAILASVIIVAAVAGSIAYVLWSGQGTAEAIKIGVLHDLDQPGGRNLWQSIILAAEQLNAEGGILGRQIEVVGEDTDIGSGIDVAKINTAVTRLLTYHRVDFIIGIPTSEAGYMVQDVVAEHKKIFFDIGSTTDQFTQRVLDDYDNYKYYFRVQFNATSIFQGMTDSLLLIREQTGFNKVGYIAEDLGWTKGVREGLDAVLPELGFDLVHKGTFPLGTFDYTSYFAKAEEAGVEVLLPLIAFDSKPFVKEYHERQSPMVIYGGTLGGGVSDPQGWETTEGKCEYTVSHSYALTSGFPLTSKTLPAREAYMSRWGEIPNSHSSRAYDILRYILPDAIERAGTIEVNAVIEALEETSIETTNARNFVFTSSHDTMMGENPNDPEADYMLVLLFQWVDGKQVPVYPKKIMEEAGVTYTFPDWLGPWDK